MGPDITVYYGIWARVSTERPAALFSDVVLIFFLGNRVVLSSIRFVYLVLERVLFGHRKIMD